jgi:hypothetical protein
MKLLHAIRPAVSRSVTDFIASRTRDPSTSEEENDDQGHHQDYYNYYSAAAA